MKKKLISLLVIPVLCLFAVGSFHFVKADTALGMVQVNLHTDGQLENSDVLKNMPITLTSTTDASQTFTLTCEDNSNVIKTKKTIPLGDYVVSFQLPKNYEALSGVYTNGPRTDTYVQNGNVVTLNEKYAYNMIYINIKEREEPQPVEKYGKVEVNLHTDGKLVESDVLKNMPVTLVPKEDSTKTYTLNCQDDSNRAELGNVPFGDYTVNFDVPEGYEDLGGNFGTSGTYVHSGTLVSIDNEYAYKQLYINVTKKEAPQPVIKYGKVEVNLHTDGKLVESDVLKNMPVTLISKEDSSKTYTLNCQDNSNRVKTEDIPLGDYTVSFNLSEGYELLSGKVGSGVMGNYLANGDTITIDNEYAYKQLYINVTKKEAPQLVIKYGKVEVNLHTDGKLVESDVLKNMPVTLISKGDPSKTYVLNCEDDSNRAKLENVPFGEYIVSFDIPEKYEVLDGKVGSGVMGNYLQNGDTIAVDSEYAYKQFYINVKEKKEAATDNGSQNHESNENASSSNDSKKQESKDPNADKKKSKSVKTAVFVNSLFFVSLSLFTGILTILFYKKTKKS